MKSENFVSLEIFKLSVEILLFKSSRMLNISGQVSLLQMLIRLSSFISTLIKDLTQIINLEVNNSHKINSILHLIKTMIKIKILTVIETAAEIMIKTEIKKKAEIKTMNVIMKIKVKVKITIKDSDSTTTFV